MSDYLEPIRADALILRQAEDLVLHAEFQTADPVGVLTQVASAIAEIPDRRVQSNLMASASILAGLVLETDVITRILRRILCRNQ